MISLSFFFPLRGPCGIREAGVAWRMPWRKRRGGQEGGGRAGLREREYIGICFVFF